MKAGIQARRLGLAGMVLMAGCDAPPGGAPSAGEPEASAPLATAPAQGAAAAYLGAQACAGCHEAAFRAWSGSHHHLAMQPANDATVLGDFDDATFEYGAVTTRLRRREDAFVVETDGPDGHIRPFQVAYAFGASPLQQYLLETDAGRLQALSIAWDSRAAGGRWFHLYPHEGVDHEDALHWTRPSQNWNSVCADCHSTNLRKRYDPATDAYATVWSEINVGCEACHGPGSQHVQAPQQPYGKAAGAMETCAQCHSRRAQLAEGYRPGEPLLDYYLPAAVAPPLYHADGQMLDEVYVYGSFLQSRMHQAGVVCADCHDVHTARLQRRGDALCQQCHSPTPPTRFPMLAERAKAYATPRHHFHESIACVDCHAPSRVYMGVDARRDHSFRIPRPDLSVAYGTPNACTGCHDDRGAAWAAAAIREHTGTAPASGAADVLALATTGAFDAEAALAAGAMDAKLPGIVRRTLLEALGIYEFGRSQDAITAGAKDADPLARLGAITHLSRLPPAPRFTAIKRLLADPLLAVRVAAAPAAAPYLAGKIAPAERQLIENALDEYRAVQRFNAETPEAHTNLAALHIALNQPQRAEAALRKALERQPHWIPALVNLADLQRATGRDAEGGAALAQAAALRPPSSDAAYAYGLWFVRQGQTARALEQLQRAHALAPEHLRNGYVYALALADAGDSAQAIAVLERCLERFGGHRSVLAALARFHRERGETGPALGYARRLREAFGAQYDALVRSLEGELAEGA